MAWFGLVVTDRSLLVDISSP